LIVFLNDISPEKVINTQPLPQPPQVTVEKPNFINTEEKALKPIFESPPLSSTRIAENFVTPTNAVIEIREKIAQATSGGMRFTSTPNVAPKNIVHKTIEADAHTDASDSSNLWNFNFDEVILSQCNRNTVAIPTNSQESIVIKELLYCLVGVAGDLIAPKTPNPTESALQFVVSKQIQESLRDMIMEIVPLANYYWQIQNFVQEKSKIESGQVLQAFCAALRGVLNDYFVSITQLETLHNKKRLNLHKLLYFVRPIMHTMEVLAQTLTEISQVLNSNILCLSAFLIFLYC
jgi:gamma-tubulin complex component 2